MHVDRLLAAVVGMWLTGCTHAMRPATPEPSKPAAEAVSANRPAARVNGLAISREAFAEAVEQHMVRYRSGGHQLPPSIELRVRESILRRMIEDTLLAQKAAELGLTVSDDELRAAIQDHMARFRSPEAFSEYLKRSQQTEDQVRAELQRHLLRTLVIAHLSGQVEITENEIHDYYTANRERFSEREQIRASRILIRVPREADRQQVHEAQSLAQDLHGEATRNPQGFADLARQHSQGPQAKRGGDLGWFARGRMHPDWDRVAFALKPGTISQPLRSEHGFEIVAVWDYRAERERPLAEVSDDIRQTLSARKSDEKRRAVLSDLEAESQVEVLIDIGATDGRTNHSPPVGDDAG